MTVREELEEIARNNNVEIVEKYIKEMDLKGLYCDNTVLLNTDMEETEKNETLAHELGHHFTLPDNQIFNDNHFFEYVADTWSYKTILPLKKLITYYIENYTLDEILEENQISQKFLDTTIGYYRDKYGLEGTVYANYIVKFFPCFHVYEIGETFDHDDL